MHIRGVPSPHLTLQTHTPFNAARDDKINDCGFNFSVVCEWRVLIEEDKDNSLQFTKFQILKATDSPKFSPTTVLHYTV